MELLTYLRFTFSYDGQVLAVTWAEPVPKGEVRKLRIEYLVDHPTSGMDFSSPDASFPDLPHFAATDHETERYNVTHQFFFVTSFSFVYSVL
jgi:hypothetical protein